MKIASQTRPYSDATIGISELDALNRDLRALLVPAARQTPRDRGLLLIALVAAIVCVVVVALIVVEAPSMIPGTTGRAALRSALDAPAAIRRGPPPDVGRGPGAFVGTGLGRWQAFRTGGLGRDLRQAPSPRSTFPFPSAATLVAKHAGSAPDLASAAQIAPPTAARAPAATNHDEEARSPGPKPARSARHHAPAGSAALPMHQARPDERASVVKEENDNVDTTSRRQRRRDRQDALDAIRALQLQ